MSECQTTNHRVPGAVWLNWAILGNLITIMHRGLCNIPSASALTPIPHTHTHMHMSLPCSGTDKMRGRARGEHTHGCVRRLRVGTNCNNRKTFHGRCFNHDSWASKPLNSSPSDLRGSEDKTMTGLYDQRVQHEEEIKSLFLCVSNFLNLKKF